MKQLLVFTLLLSFVASNNSCNKNNKNDNSLQENNPLLGEWEIREIHWKTKDTIYSIHEAQPGLLIISQNKYSIMWTPIEEVRKPFEYLSKPTDSEVLEGFKSIVFNAGTYRITDSSLITNAEIAKVPGFEGGKQYFSYILENDLLSLTMYDETYPDGNKPEWVGTFQTEFILQKVKLTRETL